MSQQHRLPDFEAYRLLVQEVRDYAIFMLDVNGYILTWNSGAQRLKGYSAEEILGAHISGFYLQEDRDSGKPQTLLAAAARDGRVEDEGWRVRKDGSRFWANVVITALYDKDEQLRGFGKVTRDISDRRQVEEMLRAQTYELIREIQERREAEDQLTRARADLERRVEQRTAELSRVNRELEDANRLKDEFLATLSHELRTPLTAIVGWIQMLRSRVLNEDQTLRALEVIERNLGVQTQLIDDLLNISRIVSGKLKVEPELVYPAAIIRQALESVKLPIEAKQLRLDLELDDELGPIRVDPARFQQIIWNLLTNAVKFTPREGAIRVGLKRLRSQIVITVADTGEGIAPEFLPHVFGRFRQADSSRSRRHGGLGLGLSIVRHLVELHGGAVVVESAGLGLGSTFAVSLPVPGFSHELVRSQEKPGGTVCSLEGVRVLVLEDEYDTREMVVRALQSSGALVREAESAERALELLEKYELDVLVSDIGMPELDGYEFLRLVRAMDREFNQIPAVALTAYADENDRIESEHAGFNAHIKKPVALADLLRTVSELHNRT